MPEEVICVPGNPAFPGKPVAVTRQGGFGSAEGTVKLIAHVNGARREAPMAPWKWADQAIQATVPGTAPGGPPYYIEVTANNQTYSGPIDVRSLPYDGSNYPPTHPPTH